MDNDDLAQGDGENGALSILEEFECETRSNSDSNPIPMPTPTPPLPGPPVITANNMPRFPSIGSSWNSEKAAELFLNGRGLDIPSSPLQASDTYSEHDEHDEVIPESPHPDKIWYTYKWNDENEDPKKTAKSKGNILQGSAAGFAVTNYAKDDLQRDLQKDLQEGIGISTNSISINGISKSMPNSQRSQASMFSSQGGYSRDVFTSPTKKITLKRNMKHLGGPIPIQSHSRFRVGLSKKARLDSLHRHLAKGQGPAHNPG